MRFNSTDIVCSSCCEMLASRRICQKQAPGARDGTIRNGVAACGVSFSFVADKSASGAHPSPLFFLCVGLAHPADKSANVECATI